MGFLILTENDESDWEDETGSRYHFPRKYLKLMEVGTPVIFYKGTLRNGKYKLLRKHSQPYYFGHGIIGKIADDPNNPKNHFAEITDYLEFAAPPLAKRGDVFFEKIPGTKVRNYWRDGVRSVDESVYSSILIAAGLHKDQLYTLGREQYMANEGREIIKTSKFYERDQRLRAETIAAKGVSCVCCGFNFERMYGDIGRGFIHIHHIKPLYGFNGANTNVSIDDLVPVCPNCHAIIHRNKRQSFSIDAVKAMIKKA